MKNRIVSILLVLLLVLPLCPVLSFAKAHFAGSGTEADPYIIADAADWTTFAANVYAGRDCGGYYKLADNFDNTASPVTDTVGTSGHPFAGVFDGGGRTLTVDISDQNREGTAPFRYISGAVIKNLTVTGSVNGGVYAAGLVGFTGSQNDIENCRVDTDVTNVKETGYRRIGGIVGNVTASSVNITDTVYSGNLYIQKKDGFAGGIVGWSDDSAEIRLGNCLYRGRFTGSETKYFHPVALKKSGASVQLTAENVRYTEKPTLTSAKYTVTSAGTLVYSASESGLARMFDLFDGRYCDESGFTMIDIPEHVPYTGEVIDPSIYRPTLADGTVLTEGVDYTLDVSPRSIKDIGYYRLTYTGIGEYAGTTSKHLLVGCENWIFLDDSLTSWNGGTYVAEGSVTIPERISVTGEVHLYLTSGADLIASKGICVNGDNSLIIDAQDETGTLTANANFHRHAALGTNDTEQFGSVVINGGTIRATGRKDGPAIGGGSGGTITINGGTVHASGTKPGAAIGGGYGGESGKTVTINGGTVYATGGEDSAAIGNGCQSRVSVIINGGTVDATGGNFSAAIGGAGIAGDVTDVTINGGNITARAGKLGAAIGGGLSHGGVATVLINGGTIDATGGDFSAAIGDGSGNNSSLNLTINGGTITARGGRNNVAIGGSKSGSAVVTINGGTVFASAGEGNPAIGAKEPGVATVTLGWTEMTDSIYSSSYSGTVSFAEHKQFIRSDNGDLATLNNINGVTILPFTGSTHLVTIQSPEHGSASVNAVTATEGQIIRVNWTTEYPYVLNSVAVAGYSGSVDFTRTGVNSGFFCMPDENVTVSVTLIKAPDVPVTSSEGSVVCSPIVEGHPDYSDGWYAVTGNIALGGRLIVHGDVKIFLCDGARLDCAGITVPAGSSLTIEGSGTLCADARGKTCQAGIGAASRGSACGNIVIRGGVIEAFGGYLAAGIGGSDVANSGSVTISSGTVTAVGGDYGAGIGSGANGKGGSVSILGGQVTARSNYAAGIGSGIYGSAVEVCLSWTSASDYIAASSYSGSVSFANGKYFKLSGTDVIADAGNINGRRIEPFRGSMYSVNLVSLNDGLGTIVGFGMKGQQDGEFAYTLPQDVTVYVRINPTYPYECTGLSVRTAGGDVIPATLVDDGQLTTTYSFVMPADNIDVMAVMNRLTPVQRVTPEGTFSFMPLRKNMNILSDEFYGVNFVVDRDVDFGENVLQLWDGSAKLYLDEGRTLKCSVVYLYQDCSGLSIYGDGTLIVDASGRIANHSAIGPHGDITIYGGTIFAKGGFCCAGIGSDETANFTGYRVVDCSITIHGGNITAIGGDHAAGIGGAFRETPKSITITGGVVNATCGGYYGAGIGGGYYAPGGNITISGGVVTATGGFEGAGIGGGTHGAGGNITITGGVVNAFGGGSRKTADETRGFGAGIGGGSHASGEGSNIVITGGQVTARGDWQTDWSQSGYPHLYSYGIGRGWKSDADDTITLVWTDPDDFIDAGEFGFGGTIVLDHDIGFYFAGTETAVTAENINCGRRIVPNRFATSVDPPTAKKGLVWNGSVQTLITSGIAAGGTLKYCLSDSEPDDAAFTTTIPSATEPGVYTVWYKAFGDENHLNSPAVGIAVTISKIVPDNPAILFEESEFLYDRTAKTPEVAVMTGSTIIDPSEYNVTYADNIGAGRATIRVAAKENGHYVFSGSAEFTIAPLTVTISGLSAENKLFDDSSAAVVTGTALLSGVLAGDDVTLSDGYADFDTPNPGTGKTVVFSEYALIGADAGNYVLASQPASVTADISALPIGTGSTVLTMTELTRTARCFTPEASDFYRFAASSELFPAFFIFEGDALIYENWQGYYIGYFDASVELEAGKDYMILLYTGYEEGDVTLIIERAPLCTVTVDEDTAHGVIVDCTEEARMGDRVYVFTEADEGFALNYLVVTTLDGESVEVEPDGFIMPGKPVTVSAVFGRLRTVDFICPEGVEIWEFSPRFYANGEFSRPGEEETTAAHGAEIEIELWTEERQSLEISVATASGEELPVTYYREFGVWIARFTMPDSEISVTLTLRDQADLNRDGTVGIGDVTELLNYLAEARPYFALYDLNRDAAISISDVTELLNILAGN